MVFLVYVRWNAYKLVTRRGKISTANPNKMVIFIILNINLMALNNTRLFYHEQISRKFIGTQDPVVISSSI